MPAEPRPRFDFEKAVATWRHMHARRRVFLKLVALAFLIATPVAYFVMYRWLENFVYRVSLGPGVFLLAGVVALGIALLTVGLRSLKAAVADPVKTLRYE